MLYGFARFIWQLFWSLFLPDWLFATEPDPKHFHRRRYTQQYRLKMRIVRQLWGGVLLLIVLVPILPVVIFAAALALFLSLAILDETP